MALYKAKCIGEDGGDSGLSNTNVIYYAKQGSASNAGDNINRPVDTIDTALTKVISPSAANPYVIISLDAASTSSGTKSIPAYTTWYAPAATHNGNVSLNGYGATIFLKRIICDPSVYCIGINGPFICFAHVDDCVAQTNARGFYLRLGSTLFVDIKNMDASALDARTYELLNSNLRGTIMRRREESLSTADVTSTVSLYIHDDGGLSAANTYIYNNFSDVDIHADGNDVNITSTGGFVSLIASAVDINGSFIVNSAGYIKSDNYFYKDNKVIGVTPAAGAFNTHVTGIAASKILPPVDVIVDGVDGRQILRENTFATNSHFGADIQSDGKLGITVLAGATNVASRNFKASLRYEP